MRTAMMAAAVMMMGTAAVVTSLLLPLLLPLLLHLLLLHQQTGDMCERLHQLLHHLLLADNGLLHLVQLLLQGVQLMRMLLAQLRLIAHKMSQGWWQSRRHRYGAVLLLQKLLLLQLML